MVAMARGSRGRGLAAAGAIPLVCGLVTLISHHVAAAPCVNGEPDRSLPYVIELSADRTTVWFRGFIDWQAPWDIYDLPETVRVAVLDSPGGVIYEGARLAQEFRRRGLTTYVPDGAACLSVCTLAFQGGARRVSHPGAVFGYHAAGIPPDWLPALGGAMEQRLAIQGLGRTNSLLRAFYEIYDAPQVLVDQALATPYDKMLLQTPEELRRAGVIHAVEDLGYRALDPPCASQGSKRDLGTEAGHGSGRSSP
jgi:hypothetical protein